MPSNPQEQLSTPPSAPNSAPQGNCSVLPYDIDIAPVHRQEISQSVGKFRIGPHPAPCLMLLSRTVPTLGSACQGPDLELGQVALWVIVSAVLLSELLGGISAAELLDPR